MRVNWMKVGLVIGLFFGLLTLGLIFKSKRNAEMFSTTSPVREGFEARQKYLALPKSQEP